MVSVDGNVKERTVLAEAIRELCQEYLHETQESFARRIGTHPVNLARWETFRVPSSVSLAKLRDLAKGAGFERGVVVFDGALKRGGTKGAVAKPEQKRDDELVALVDSILGSWHVLMASIKEADGKELTVRRELARARVSEDLEKLWDMVNGIGAP